MKSAIKKEIVTDSSFINLKSVPIRKMRKEVSDMLLKDEEVISVFKTVRDQVIFTTLRVIVINVLGVTGTKVCYFSYPYKKLAYWGVQKAGMADIDSELLLVFINGKAIQFDFSYTVDIRKVCNTISRYIL